VRTRTVDFAAVRERLAGRCFICELLAGNPEFAHHIVYEDDHAVAFLNRYPALYGYVLVAPRQHRELVTSDFTRGEYLRLQEVVHRVGEAIRRVVPTERLYILSLGSRQGNRHVHWHLAPLPPGVPFEQQQFAALDTSVCLDVSDDELAELARKLREAILVSAAEPHAVDDEPRLEEA
jgi:diadenosine tetraphosphate (Ap4A) HIT family hydrolase